MTRPDLAPDLRRFIVTSIPSVPYLEAVLLMRAEPHVQWDARRMASRLYLGEAEARGLLDAAAAGGIAAPQGPAESPTFAFMPSTPEIAQVLDRLAAHYAIDLVTVADLIHSGRDKRVQQFADAFRFRKDT